ncbi:MAG: hypothetical protein SGI77_25450 [Pirellulaceae bacterium]|nr:hypothetical protein [Pirellulaceae bacterium]
MILPPPLLEALAAPAGGRVVLVIGAGTSLEPPTLIPLALECAREAHRRLLADGILNPTDCSNPDDLSILADTVKSKTGGQAELVLRLPTPEFKTAPPNDGHLIAAALMMEGAIANIVTLNFDLSLNHALSQVSANNDVSIIKGPEEHHGLGRSNVIYLHRNVEAEPENWILTTDALGDAWRDNWEEVIVRFATAAPVTVFAGLGSPCGVLSHSIRKIQLALRDNANIYLAGPGEVEDSCFASELQITTDQYVKLGWVDLMRGFADRIITEITHHISISCKELIRREGWVEENIDRLCERLIGLGMVDFGRLRAAWLLDDRTYLKAEVGHLPLIADLLLAIGTIERVKGLTASIFPNGIVELRSATQSWLIRVASGRGILRWASMEARLLYREKYESAVVPTACSRTVLVSGVIGQRFAVAPPASILGTIDENSIVGTDTTLLLVDVDQIRCVPPILEEMFA